MKKITFIALLVAGFSQAQTIYFEEDFESTDAVTTIRNANFTTGAFEEDQLPDGPPSCGAMSRSDAASVNSANVDFNSSQNDGKFLVVNPENACGGFYNAAARSIILDLSAATGDLYISGRYYATSTLEWGPLDFGLALYNGTADLSFDSSNFTVRDNWTEFEFVIPQSFATSTVTFGVAGAAGEAFAFDDFVISDYSVLSVNAFNEIEANLYPNPVKGNRLYLQSNSALDVEIFDILGKSIKSLKAVSQGFDISDLKDGVYLMKLSGESGSVLKKIIKL